METTQSGGEVRKLNIVSILSGRDRIEAPHLIRVRHNSRNGVHLRDVKQWLAGVRGNDMPGSYAWSYKRKIPKGFIWEDLHDDDLITPYSNNEYVLKGSEILSYHTPSQGTEQTGSSSPTQTEPLLIKTREKSSRKNAMTRRRSLSDIKEELCESTLPDDCMKEEGESSYSSLYLNIYNKNAKKITPPDKTMENTTSYHTFSTKSKGHGNAKTLHDLFSCRTIKTNDSITVPFVNRQKKSSLKNCCKGNTDECEEAIKMHRRSNGEYSKIQPRNSTS